MTEPSVVTAIADLPDSRIVHSRGGLPPGTGPLDKPIDVLYFPCKAVILPALHGLDGRAMPFVNFRVGVSKNEAARSIVVTGRQIHKSGGLSRVWNQPSVINAVRMFIHQQPGHGWTRASEAGRLDVLKVSRIPIIDASGSAVLSIPNKPIHRVAADS